ncbi:MAG: hypothetical protein GQF41_2076 [Candidatus Rifleibacterium amylolyticum]|nr:MAG: hypothetical protein GQF41_2076 [Candidatus Rifleibacterium amylolyticum]
MAIMVVRLGTERSEDEGMRIGTVRRPPRGVTKDRYAQENWFDVWLPELSPEPETMKLGKEAADEKSWLNFQKKFTAELKTPEKQHLLQLLAGFSKQTNFSIGCYCEDESRCHRSILATMLAQHGADIK